MEDHPHVLNDLAVVRLHGARVSWKHVHRLNPPQPDAKGGELEAVEQRLLSQCLAGTAGGEYEEAGETLAQ